jgi:hypothetical protein
MEFSGGWTSEGSSAPGDFSTEGTFWFWFLNCKDMNMCHSSSYVLAGFQYKISTFPTYHLNTSKGMGGKGKDKWRWLRQLWARKQSAAQWRSPAVGAKNRGCPSIQHRLEFAPIMQRPSFSQKAIPLTWTSTVWSLTAESK